MTLKLPGALGGGTNGYIIGFDLGDIYSGISYCMQGGEVETLSLVTGEENYSIPTVLCKRREANQWFYGTEALKYAEEKGGILIDHLLSKALDGETIMVDGTGYEPVSLLTLFLKRTISLVTSTHVSDRMQAILFTVPVLDARAMEVLKEAATALKFKPDQVFFQSHTESFYHYMIRQPENLWIRGALLVSHEGNELRILKMDLNRHTQPIVVFIGEDVFPFSDTPRNNAPDADYQFAQLDQMLLNILRELCSGVLYSSVYLIGEQFAGQWMEATLKYLCSSFRVFLGSNLYSKGAVYGLQDRLDEDGDNTHVFLGNEKLTSNVGISLLRQGEEVYYALLDAGVNWFEAEETFDFYLQEGNTLDLQISSLIGGGKRIARITLEDFHPALTRMRMHLYLTDVHTLNVQVEDLGLGAINSGTHRIWNEIIEL